MEKTSISRLMLGVQPNPEPIAFQDRLNIGNEVKVDIHSRNSFVEAIKHHRRLKEKRANKKKFCCNIS